MRIIAIEREMESRTTWRHIISISNSVEYFLAAAAAAAGWYRWVFSFCVCARALKLDFEFASLSKLGIFCFQLQDKIQPTKKYRHVSTHILKIGTEKAEWARAHTQNSAAAAAATVALLWRTFNSISLEKRQWRWHPHEKILATTFSQMYLCACYIKYIAHAIVRIR